MTNPPNPLFSQKMKSPFPGMDPYLEAHWGDLHHSLIQYARDAMQAELPNSLRARVEERIYVEDDASRRHIVPDVHIAQVHGWDTGLHSEGNLIVAEPIVVEWFPPTTTEGYIEIRDRDGGQVVTVIEFLSPANKVGGVGQTKYLEKQDQILRSHASLVEIDLVRTGNYVMAAPRAGITDELLDDYLTCISPGSARSRFELYPMPIRQRLPILPIPLRPTDKRITLDLQQLLDHAYVAGRYDDTNYSAPPPVPLKPEDSIWAAGLVKTQ